MRLIDELNRTKELAVSQPERDCCDRLIAALEAGEGVAKMLRRIRKQPWHEEALKAWEEATR